MGGAILIELSRLEGKGKEQFGIYVMSIVRVPCVYPDAVRTSEWLRSGRVKAEASKTFRPASRKAWRGAVSFTCTYTRVSNADLSHADGDAVTHIRDHSTHPDGAHSAAGGGLPIHVDRAGGRQVLGGRYKGLQLPLPACYFN